VTATLVAKNVEGGFAQLVGASTLAASQVLVVQRISSRVAVCVWFGWCGRVVSYMAGPWGVRWVSW
jgi:hypothetical protein